MKLIITLVIFALVGVARGQTNTSYFIKPIVNGAGVKVDLRVSANKYLLIFESVDGSNLSLWNAFHFAPSDSSIIEPINFEVAVESISEWKGGVFHFGYRQSVNFLKARIEKGTGTYFTGTEFLSSTNRIINEWLSWRSFASDISKWQPLEDDKMETLLLYNLKVFNHRPDFSLLVYQTDNLDNISKNIDGYTIHKKNNHFYIKEPPINGAQQEKEICEVRYSKTPTAVGPTGGGGRGGGWRGSVLTGVQNARVLVEQGRVSAGDK